MPLPLRVLAKLPLGLFGFASPRYWLSPAPRGGHLQRPSKKTRFIRNAVGHWRCLAATLSLMLGVVAAVDAQTPATSAGRVKTAMGSTSIVRAGQPVAASVGMEVLASDVLRTGSDGRLAVSLKDDTRLSLGPDTEVSLQQFAFAPAEGRMSMVLRMVKGALSYISGRIARLSPSSVRIETPSSVIAVRGTHVLVRVEGP